MVVGLIAWLISVGVALPTESEVTGVITLFAPLVVKSPELVTEVDVAALAEVSIFVDGNPPLADGLAGVSEGTTTELVGLPAELVAEVSELSISVDDVSPVESADEVSELVTEVDDALPVDW